MISGIGLLFIRSCSGIEMAKTLSKSYQFYQRIWDT